MMKRCRRSTQLFVVLALIAGHVPTRARAEDGSKNRRIQIHAAAASGPIGKIFSVGQIVINGRVAHGEQTIWAGDLVSTEETSASGNLDYVGRIMLLKASRARLIAPTDGHGLEGGEATLHAVLLAGWILVSLQSNAMAKIVVADWVISSTRGSNFKVGMLGDTPVVEVERGSVTRELQQPTVRYKVVPAKLEKGTGRYVESSQNTIKVRTDKFEPIPIKVKPQPGVGPIRKLESTATTVAYQAPASPPISGIEVEFCLGSLAIGSLNTAGSRCATAMTDPEGVAIVQFHAGPDEAKSKIRATVVSSKDYWEGDIEVYKPPGVWRARNIAILAAAAGVATICLLKCGPSRGPLRQEPPPQIP